MSERNYKYAFAASAVVAVVLAVTLGYLLFQRDGRSAPPEESNPVVAKGPDASSQIPLAAPSSGASAPSLTPVQISPQRLQAIGVKTADVEMRNVHDELRVPGNVEIDEQQLAYVQTRFPGWI